MLETFGRRPAFLVGWFLTLFAISVCAFEAVVLGSLFRSLFPAIATGVAYTVGRTSIDWGSLGLGLVGTLVISGLHIRGAQACPDMASPMPFANATTGYLVDDNGTGRVWTFAQVLEAAK